jgi:hypothetical protein
MYHGSAISSPASGLALGWLTPQIWKVKFSNFRLCMMAHSVGRVRRTDNSRWGIPVNLLPPPRSL